MPFLRQPNTGYSILFGRTPTTTTNQTTQSTNPFNIPIPNNPMYHPVHSPYTPQQDAQWKATHPDAMTALVSNTAAVDLNEYKKDPFGFILKYYGLAGANQLYNHGYGTAYGIKGQFNTTRFFANEDFFRGYEEYMRTHMGNANGGGTSGGCPFASSGGCNGGGSLFGGVSTGGQVPIGGAGTDRHPIEEPAPLKVDTLISNLGGDVVGTNGLALGQLPPSPYDNRKAPKEAKLKKKAVKAPTPLTPFEELPLLGAVSPTISLLGVNL